VENLQAKTGHQRSVRELHQLRRSQ